MTDSSASGGDLARAAYQAARAAAKNAPAPKRRMGAARPKRDRTGGRDPLPFAAAIQRMMTERGWDTAAKGGSILEQWPTIAPELAGKVAAVKFDDDTRTLHLRPVSPAYRQQLEWFQQQTLARINQKVGEGTVHALKILTPGPVDLTPPLEEARPQSRKPRKPAPSAMPAVPRQRDPRYLKVLAVHNAYKMTRETDMDRRILAAAEDQTRRILARREPEDAFTEPAAQDEILRVKDGRRGPKDSPQVSVRTGPGLPTHRPPSGRRPRTAVRSLMTQRICVVRERLDA